MSTVGVTMSVFNGAATVGQALASVAAQSRRPDAVVVVDDGSTDDTLLQVEAWASVLPLTIVQHGTNRGLSAGRLTGISNVETDTVLAIDADDVWLPDHVGRMLTAHASRGGVVSPMAVAWDPTLARPVNWHRRLQPLPRREDLRHLILMNWLFSGSLFARADFDAVGGVYRFPGCDDWDLWLRLARSAVPLSVLHEPTVLYRIHEGSMSADDRLLSTEIDVLETFLDETTDRVLRRATKQSLRHRRARQALRESYRQAREGRTGAARRAAMKSLRGSPPVVVRGVSMLVAPMPTMTQRDVRSTRPGAGF